MNKIEKKVAIIGGGPAGLFCAQLLTSARIHTVLFDHMDPPGKKFILAGLSGGLNITNSLPLDKFCRNYYGHEKLFRQLLEDFSPADLENWCHQMGSSTFRGNGGKIFTEKPAYMILSQWLSELESSGCFQLKTGYSLKRITDENNLVFTAEGKEVCFHPDSAVFAMGGGSRSNTGSDGKWLKIFNERGIETAPLKPSNCGFTVCWSPFLQEKFSKDPESQQISVHFAGHQSKGEIVFTPYGIEGSGIYSISHFIREEIEKNGKCNAKLDIVPDLDIRQLKEKMARPIEKMTLSNYMKKTLKISGIKFMLMKELLKPAELSDIRNRPEIIKSLELEICAPRPLEEAISSAGGITFQELDENFMLKKIPGFYAIGEMADWEAPTGGFMLQGCFSTAFRAASDIIKRMKV